MLFITKTGALWPEKTSFKYDLPGDVSSDWFFWCCLPGGFHLFWRICIKWLWGLLATAPAFCVVIENVCQLESTNKPWNVIKTNGNCRSMLILKWKLPAYPPVSSNMACWKTDHFVSDFPIKTSIQFRDFPASHAWWNQKVNPLSQWDKS